jgi:hypothetical protein
MENGQTEVVVIQPAEAQTEARKKATIFWIGLDLVAILFWLYAVVKLFVFDVDVYFASLAGPEFVWLLNYKLLILLGFVLIAMLITRSLVLGLSVVYIAVYPLVICFWKLPRLVWKQQSWIH